MDIILSKFSPPGILFIITLAAGFWLSAAGKPLNPWIFNLHKLIALAAVILATIQLVDLFKQKGSSAAILTLLILAGICVLALFASGALMSAGQLRYDLMLIIHRVAPFGIVFSLAGALYFLVGNG